MKLTRLGKMIRKLAKEFDESQWTETEKKIVEALKETSEAKVSRLDGAWAWILILVLMYFFLTRSGEPCNEEKGGGFSSMAMPFIMSMMAKMKMQEQPQTEQEPEGQPQDEEVAK